MTRCLAIMLAFFMWSCCATAQPFPALYDVQGVAGDDVLNIRSDPDEGSAIIGQFAPTATGIEVLGVDPSGQWARINSGESQGWAALRFLARSEPAGTFPDNSTLSCFGTEPFWSLAARRHGPARLDVSGVGQIEYSTATIHVANGRSDRFVLDLGAPAAAVIRRAACSDGMSDRGFGLQIDLIVQGAPAQLYSGCCSIAAR